MYSKIAPEKNADSSEVACDLPAHQSVYVFLGIGTANGTITVLDLRDNGEQYNNRVNRTMSFKLLYTHKEHRGWAITALRWSSHSKSYKLFSGCGQGRVIELSISRVLSQDEEDNSCDSKEAATTATLIGFSKPYCEHDFE